MATTCVSENPIFWWLSPHMVAKYLNRVCDCEGASPTLTKTSYVVRPKFKVSIVCTLYSVIYPGLRLASLTTFSRPWEAFATSKKAHLPKGSVAKPPVYGYQLRQRGHRNDFSPEYYSLACTVRDIVDRPGRYHFVLRKKHGPPSYQVDSSNAASNLSRRRYGGYSSRDESRQA